MASLKKRKIRKAIARRTKEVESIKLIKLGETSLYKLVF